MLGAMTNSPASPNTATAKTPAVGTASSAVTIASYADYAKAQKAVDFLSDEGFPVQHTAIVGSDLHLVESVTGRVTVFRAALQGAVTGVWAGLLLGVILALANEGDGGLLGIAILVGALGGTVYYAVSHALTRGNRDFASRSEIVAQQYDVTVAAEHVDHAKGTLAKLQQG